ncbi:hypothetical protein F53441_288 [Fusarium austroafricanum]|uniref:Extracellular membrane protein CFEM domain-containing protein n=1 Tax=Fusarium austroafricanum TaxID=2364996 RepID=A0A8H4P3N0_9HYPO|nr:hypothetical protein F53441_288 [Fusarium austroafricanum]
MRFSSSLAALVAIAGFSSASPNGWSKTKEAPDSPSKLEDCGCSKISDAILKCQKLKVTENTDDCVCMDNSNPDGWYGYMDGCRNCLSGSGDEEFFDNVAKLVTQLFVSCTNAGGGVRSNGHSLCASNAYREACLSLGVNGKPSWASYEVFQEKVVGNATYTLDLKGPEEKSTIVKSTASKTTVATAATDASTGTSTATTTASDDASATGTAVTVTTPTSSSAAAPGGSRAGLLESALVAAILKIALF